MGGGGPILLILGVLASTFIGPVLMGPPLIVVWSTAVLFVVSVLLFSMFASVLFKGLGSSRTIGSVLVVSVFSILTLISHFAVLYKWVGFRDTATGKQSESFFEAFYFSVVTWTTLGYGDFVPVGNSRYIVVTEALLGYLVMALLISVFVASISRRRH